MRANPLARITSPAEGLAEVKSNASLRFLTSQIDLIPKTIANMRSSIATMLATYTVSGTIAEADPAVPDFAVTLFDRATFGIV